MPTSYMCIVIGPCQWALCLLLAYVCYAHSSLLWIVPIQSWVLCPVHTYVCHVWSLYVYVMLSPCLYALSWSFFMPGPCLCMLCPVFVCVYYAQSWPISVMPITYLHYAQSLSMCIMASPCLCALCLIQVSVLKPSRCLSKSCLIITYVSYAWSWPVHVIRPCLCALCLVFVYVCYACFLFVSTVRSYCLYAL